MNQTKKQMKIFLYGCKKHNQIISTLKYENESKLIALISEENPEAQINSNKLDMNNL